MQQDDRSKATGEELCKTLSSQMGKAFVRLWETPLKRWGARNHLHPDPGDGHTGVFAS